MRGGRTCADNEKRRYPLKISSVRQRVSQADRMDGCGGGHDGRKRVSQKGPNSGGRLRNLGKYLQKFLVNLGESEAQKRNLDS